MASSAPAGWREVTLEVSAVDSVMESGLEATTSAGEVLDSETIDDAGEEAVEELREAMYKPETGTWYQAKFKLSSAGDLDVDFDYVNPPLNGDATPEMLEDDQRKFPRSVEYLPDWHPAKSES